MDWDCVFEILKAYRKRYKLRYALCVSVCFETHMKTNFGTSGPCLLHWVYFLTSYDNSYTFSSYFLLQSYKSLACQWLSRLRSVSQWNDTLSFIFLQSLQVFFSLFSKTCQRWSCTGRISNLLRASDFLCFSLWSSIHCQHLPTCVRLEDGKRL